MRTTLVRIACICALTAFAAPAFADEAEAELEDAPEAPASSLSGIRLDVGSGLLFSDRSDASFRRYNVYFMPVLSFHERLAIAPRVNLSTIDLSLRQPRGLPVDVDLSFPWQMSLGFDLRYRHPLLSWLEASVFYRFEFPTSAAIARIGTFRIHPIDGAPDAEHVLDRIRDNIAVAHTWRHFALGATLMAHMQRWHPFVDVGYTSTTGRISVSFTREATDLLGMADIDPARFHDTSLKSMYYSAGSEFDIGSGFRLRAQATAVVLPDLWVVITDVALSVPMH